MVFVPILSRRCAASVTYSGGAREQLHALRKAIKKLRYGIEFALHPHKQVKANLRPCKSLQELLGTVNDAAVTLTLSEQLPKTGEELTQGIGALEVWAGDRAGTLLMAANHQPTRLAAVLRPSELLEWCPF